MLSSKYFNRVFWCMCKTAQVHNGFNNFQIIFQKRNNTVGDNAHKRLWLELRQCLMLQLFDTIHVMNDLIIRVAKFFFIELKQTNNKNLHSNRKKKKTPEPFFAAK